MTYYLAKTEPDVYSLQQLQQDGQTCWDGVRNPQAVKAIRSMKPHDRILIYHSGGVSAIVGLAEVVSPPRDDPKDPKSVHIDVRFLQEFPEAISLKEIKATGQFADFALVRQSRLSTMPVPDAFLAWLRQRLPRLKL